MQFSTNLGRRAAAEWTINMGMTMREYLASLKNKRVAVIGIGISNTPLIKLLLRNGIDVTACDKNGRDSFDGLAEELESLGARLQFGPEYLSGLNHHVIFRTPGMRPDVPELQEAVAHGSVITSEMEAFFEICPCEIIGVTGSDGKTTTTTIIAELLRAAGYNVYLGGNIGRPLFTDASEMVPDDFAVLELSSFQLMTMKKSPAIAVVTNLAPNHLDVHTSMSEYIAAKENIFIHQTAEGKAVFNLDNEITKAFASKAKGKVMMFSRKETVPGGIYVKDGSIFSGREGFEREILPLQDILLPGDHNVENYMAAIAAVEGLVSDQIIREFAASFTGVEHRIELVRTWGGVNFYNDSIATSPTRTIAGLHCFPDKVILIAGGYDKHIPFTVLGPVISERVKTLILTGDTAGQIRDAVKAAPEYAEGSPEILEIDDFEEAVRQAAAIAQAGDVVLLSPACAAFDRFKNFAVRGETFKRIVNSL